MTKQELLQLREILQWCATFATTVGRVNRIGESREVVEREIRLKELAELMPKEKMHNGFCSIHENGICNCDEGRE